MLTDCLNGCFGSKDKIRGCDYRLSTVVVSANMKEKCSPQIEGILRTMTEIVKIAYTKADERSPKYILRLYNITFQHAMLCVNTLSKSTKLSKEKLFGIYFHSLICHLPHVARIISPNSVHTEDEERLFSVIKNISMRTSNRSLQSIRDNSIIRLQAEQSLQTEDLLSSHQYESQISKFSKAVGKFPFISCIDNVI